ncbi:hypothetical protein HY994_01605 [Candidatus Micrarchaeota archaeon]|nr:hypothetical protein [Candidatus Micrarchaeota archaeon]
MGCDFDWFFKAPGILSCMAPNQVMLHRYRMGDRVSGTPLRVFSLEVSGRSPWFAASKDLALAQTRYERGWAKWHHQLDDLESGHAFKTRITPDSFALESANECMSFSCSDKGKLFIDYVQPEEDRAPTDAQLKRFLGSVFPGSAVHIRNHDDAFVDKLRVPLQVYVDEDGFKGNKAHSVRFDLPFVSSVDEKIAERDDLVPFCALFAQAVAAGHLNYSPHDELARFMEVSGVQLRGELENYLLPGAIERALKKTRLLKPDLSRISLVHPLPPENPQDTYKKIVRYLSAHFAEHGLVIHGTPD